MMLLNGLLFWRTGNALVIFLLGGSVRLSRVPAGRRGPALLDTKSSGQGSQVILSSLVYKLGMIVLSLSA